MVMFQSDGIEEIFFEPLANAIYAYKPQYHILQRIYDNPYEQHLRTDFFQLKGAKNLKIDSAMAYLCWIEFHQTIKCANLPDLMNLKFVYQLDR